MQWLLKIEHRGQKKFYANNSKTIEFSKILMKGSNVHHQKTDLCRNFQNDSSPYVEVMAPETDFFVIFHVYNLENLLPKPCDKI